MWTHGEQANTCTKHGYIAGPPRSALHLALTSRLGKAPLTPYNQPYIALTSRLGTAPLTPYNQPYIAPLTPYNEAVLDHIFCFIGWFQLSGELSYTNTVKYWKCWSAVKIDELIRNNGEQGGSTSGRASPASLKSASETTFPVLWGSLSSRVCYSIQIPYNIGNVGKTDTVMQD